MAARASESRVSLWTAGAIASLAMVGLALAMSSPAAAANAPPREGCGALTLAEETNLLNSTMGVQNRWVAVNVTLCDPDEPQYNLTYAVEINPAQKWSQQLNATGNLMLFAVFPDNSMVGFNWFNVTLCDSLAACTRVSFHVWIDNVNDAPRINTGGEKRTATQGQAFSLRIDATDPDDQVPWLPPTRLSFRDDTALFDISQDGWITFTPTNDQVTGSGPWQVTVWVTDNGNPPLTDSHRFDIEVQNANDAPVFPAYSSINVTQDLRFVAPLLKAYDADLALFEVLPPALQEAITYSDSCPLFDIERVDTVNPTSGQPEPAGKISILATNSQVGDWDCLVTVTDREGATDTLSLHVRVNNVNDAPTSLRVNITDTATGEMQTVVIDNSKVIYDQDTPLLIQVLVDDPDLHMRVGQPGVPVDANEALTCSILSTFISTLEVPPGSAEKPTIDPHQCISEFTPSNNEVGTFAVTITVRDAQQISVTFRFKLEIRDVGELPLLRILTPLDGFVLESGQTVTLSGSAADVDTPDHLLVYQWTIEVGGGPTYIAIGKTASVVLQGGQTLEARVTISLTVTDNGDPANPGTASTSINGSVRGTGTMPAFSVVPSSAPVQEEGSLSVSFQANPTGGTAPYTYAWDFGDGNHSSEARPVHAYAAEGRYEVRVQVTDAQGLEIVRWMNVTVSPQTGEVPGATGVMLSLGLLAAAVAAGVVLFLVQGRRREP